jgi:hypothetical protein
VASPVSIAAVAKAVQESLSETGLPARARALIQERYAASHALLTESGTSALVLALRLVVPDGGIVAFPGYACVDLAAAAIRAGVRVRLYDLDPVTLSPDLESVERTLERGVAAIVVVHLFGYPADIDGIRALASPRGVTLIEDAAQGTGGALHGRRLGSHGDLSVLSFGRGKGLCAGGGGALLAFRDPWTARLDDVTLPPPARGLYGQFKTAVQWALGRPSVYILPSMVPWLHLGEMVYHEAGEPGALSLASSSLLRSALAHEDAEVAVRRRHAASLDTAARGAWDIGMTMPIPGAEPGYLRYAVRDVSGLRAASAVLGVARPYPQTLAEQPQLAPLLLANEPLTSGAAALRRSLFTWPTHSLLAATDLRGLAGWIDHTVA